MEWVETTGKTIEEAQDRALDRLGVAEDEAEIEVLEEPRAGLFGLIRGEARIRARVRPAEVRPKADRRRGRKSERHGRDGGAVATASPDGADGADGAVEAPSTDASADAASSPSASDERPSGRGRNGNGRGRRSDGDRNEERGDGRRGRSDGDDAEESDVDPAAVGAAAVTFMEGLLEAFGLEGTVELLSDGVDLEVRVAGDELGLLIGPGGRTLTAIQDLVRVAAQRRLGDHETRLRVDVAGYRERRKVALERFTRSVAEQVIASGTPKSMEPMPSADRKIVHDVLNEIDGVRSRSEGDDPYRRVVVEPS